MTTIASYCETLADLVARTPPGADARKVESLTARILSGLRGDDQAVALVAAIRKSADLLLSGRPADAEREAIRAAMQRQVAQLTARARQLDRSRS